jgi:EAL domain-containing protein (putative c-di-GMP-specific phosphodiesterase class I)/cellulose synthase/poly-beta-1,6-N-acetylglucosamine synthase-like glycosyltransferase
MQSTMETVKRPRRQWGSDRRDKPLPTVPPPVSDRRIRMGRLAIVLTVSAWLAYTSFTIFQQFIEGRADSARLVIEAIVYMFVVTALTASAMAYLITRIGFFYRSRVHRRAPRAAIDDFFEQNIPTVTVLVPSYQEDERVVRTTLLSAALQEHPYLRIVLLVDDPPEPTSPHAREILEQSRSLPGRIQELLAEPCTRFQAALDRFEHSQTGDCDPTVADVVAVADDYHHAVSWLRELAAAQEIVDHSDSFFADHVVGALADDLEIIALALDAAAAEGATLPARRLRQLHQRLVATFRAELTSFERKQYVSLSHAPNKAMNLNSYIGLMGGSYKEVATPLGTALVACAPRSADLTVPDPDYVLTLDADSVLLPEYTVRILHLMEQSAHAKVGVAQTPYSSYPGSATRIERIAGATTDLQHIVHQGMTHYDATFWVGANAILRKRALEDIVEIDYEGDWEIRRYIQDRTVIEDTESTIDLGCHGWTLLNYPERLAYSATPPDFGSLCIQRQRWANGGLLILSKLRKQSKARKARGEPNRFGEVFLRINYMASIFWSSICLLVMLCYPFNSGLLNPILLLVALPYFVMMASDLAYCGYKRLDVLRIYGFNLILLPVNLSGSFASILQLVTGEKSAFKRTPKVRDRTTASATFILAPVALIAFATYTVVLDLRLHRWENLAYATLNALLALYALVAFVGILNCIVDLWLQLRGWLYKPVTVPKVSVAVVPALDGGSGPVITDWASVLYYGTADTAKTSVIAKRPSREASQESRADGAVASEGPIGHQVAEAVRPPSSSASAGAPMASGLFEEFTFFSVFQPIVDLDLDRPVGFEALTRFADGRRPDVALADAEATGRATELDAALVRSALVSAVELPPGTWVSINVSPGLAERPELLAEVLAEAPCPVVVEYSADGVTDPAEWVATLPANVMVAVDDAGAGYDSLALLEHLRPSFMKLDRTTVTGIEIDAARQAFVRTLVTFAEENGCRVIAEGVESDAEREALHDAGVHLAQGYLLGRPVPVDRTSELIR